MATQLPYINSFNLRQLREYMKCQKCLRLPMLGATLWRCNRRKCLVCSSCVLLSLRCPMEKCQSSPTQALVHQEVVYSMMASIFNYHPCIYFRNGCNTEKIPSELKSHEDLCIWQHIPCPFLYCKDKVVFNNVHRHFGEVHTYIQMGETSKRTLFWWLDYIVKLLKTSMRLLLTTNNFSPNLHEIANFSTWESSCIVSMKNTFHSKQYWTAI